MAIDLSEESPYRTNAPNPAAVPNPGSDKGHYRESFLRQPAGRLPCHLSESRLFGHLPEHPWRHCNADKGSSHARNGMRCFPQMVTAAQSHSRRTNWSPRPRSSSRHAMQNWCRAALKYSATTAPPGSVGKIWPRVFSCERVSNAPVLPCLPS